MVKRTALFGRAVQAADAPGVSDRDLMRRFADDADQSAFAAVVKRHTALVYGVCVRVMHSAADADDATQAVFLVLAKKAKGTRWQSSIANWLYTTARKVAHNARLAAVRRSKREGAAAVPEGVSPADAMSGRELVAALDDELDKLPPRYREPLVLCYLEGLTRDDAAARLGLAVPALNKQLERGRKKLADALAARGCALGVLLLAVAATSTASAAAPNTVESILTAVGGKPSAAAVALAQALTMNSVVSRAKLTALALLGLTLGLGAVAAMPSPADPPKDDTREKPKAEKAEAKERTISGTVVGPDGKPVAGASINTMKTGMFDALASAVSGKPVVKTLAKTDDDGKFSVKLEPLAPGQLDYRTLLATKPGFGPDWVMVSALSGESVTLKLVSDDVAVKGTVTDLEGKPVAKATVRIKTLAAGDLGKVWEMWPRGPYYALQAAKNQLWMPTLAGFPESVTADAEGKFEIHGVGRGRLLTLVFESPGIETAACRVVTDPAFDPKKVEQPTHATMPGGSFQPGPVLYGPTFTHTGRPSQPVTGTVTDAKTGKPIVGVQVNGHDDGPHWWENNAYTKSDADGKFTLSGIAKTERVRLSVFAGEKSPYFLYETTVGGKPGLTEITAELKLTRGVILKGRVVEKGTDTPVVGAGIRYTPLADNKHYAELMKGKRNVDGMGYGTDADGRFEFVALPGAGVVTAQGETRAEQIFIPYTQVRVAKADLPRANLRDLEGLGEMFTAADGHYVTLHSLSGYAIIDPKPTDETAEVTIEFDRGKTVSGKVLDADGKPATGLTAYQLTACYSYPQKVTDGTFTAIALEADHPRTVLFVDEAKKLAGSVDLKGDEKDVTVKLQPWGKLSGRLLDADGKPLAGASVSVFVKNSMRHMAFMAAVREQKATTDKDGRYTLDVPAGPAEYLIGFCVKNKYVDVGFTPNTKGHAVKPGETTDVGDVKVKE